MSNSLEALLPGISPDEARRGNFKEARAIIRGLRKLGFQATMEFDGPHVSCTISGENLVLTAGAHGKSSDKLAQLVVDTAIRFIYYYPQNLLPTPLPLSWRPAPA